MPEVVIARCARMASRSERGDGMVRDHGQCAGDSRRGTLGTQHIAADCRASPRCARRLCRCIAGKGGDPARHAQDHPGAARAGQIMPREWAGAQNHRLRLEDGGLDQGQSSSACAAGRGGGTSGQAADTGLPVQSRSTDDQIEPALAAGADRCCLITCPGGAARGGRSCRGRVPNEASVESARHDPRDCRDWRRFYLGRADHPVGAGGRHWARLRMNRSQRTHSF